MPTSAAIYAPPSGHSVITLSGSVTTDAQFATQPAVDDQIVYPSALGVSAQLVVTGAAGTYTFWHVRQAGVAVNTTYVLENVGAPTLADPIIDQITGSTFRFRAQTNESGWTGYVAKSTAPILDADVVSTGEAAAVTTAGQLTHNASGLTPASLYYVKAVHVDADDNLSNVISEQQTTLASGTIASPAVYSLPAGYTLATLASGFDEYCFDGWPDGEPAVGWQLITLTADGYFDSGGNYYSDQAAVHDFWVIEPDGTITVQEIDATGNPFLVVGTPSTGSTALYPGSTHGTPSTQFTAPPPDRVIPGPELSATVTDANDAVMPPTVISVVVTPWPLSGSWVRLDAWWTSLI